MLNEIIMRFTLTAMVALLFVFSFKFLPTNNQQLRPKQSDSTPLPSDRHLGCTHCDHEGVSGGSAWRQKLTHATGMLWEQQYVDPASAPVSLSLVGSVPMARKYQAGTRQRISLEGGVELQIDVSERFTHIDGTVAVSGHVTGKPGSRTHIQWNERDDFFLGQIYFDGQAIAYQITRDNLKNHTITRHSVDQLVCAEIDTASGNVRYGLPPLPASLEMESEGAGEGGGGEQEAPSLVPALNSYPSATAVVYLDFDGQQVNGTSWGSNINAAATGYSASKITDIWNRVAADMEPFNLNVTTDESAYLNAPASKRIRCIITPSNEWYGSNSAGGVAKLGGFTWSGDTPCWVFSDNLANGTKYIAEACSHEVGHTLGLSHDGKTGTSYYAGHGSGAVGWAPIMGNSYFKNMTQWSKGEYSSPTNTQDDLSIITSGSNGFGYRGDDHNGQASSATYLIADASNQLSANGTIERKDDVDVFEFESGTGSLSLTMTPSSSFGNLDIHAELYDINGSLIASSNPTTQLNASISANVTTGSYFLHIRATGYGSANTGFTNYACLGSYGISGEIATPTVPTPFEISVASLPTNQRGTSDDPDGDGVNNLAEHALDTDPSTAEASLHFSSMDASNPSGVAFLIDLPSDIPSDVIYTVEATCTLNPNGWTSIATRATSGIWSGTANVSEEIGPNGKRRFRISETSGGPWTCRFLRVKFELQP